MSKIQHTFKIVSNERITSRYHLLSIDAKPVLKKIRAGQFVHIRVQDSLEPFLRRPFSVYRAQKNLQIFYEVVGKGTQILASKKKGDPLDVLGPLGNYFRLPPPKTKNVIMIAGGIGVAPFLILSDKLKKRSLKMILLYGGRTKDHVCSMKEFKRNGCQVHVATDDGSVGVKGRVSKLFSRIDPNSQTTFLYTCGPKPMMASVVQFARRYSLEGQMSCEETMACGLGACLGCSIKTQSGYKTVCHDGPVFDLNEML